MKGTTHLKLGVAAGICMGTMGYKGFLHQDLPMSLCIGIGSALGGIFPDIDSKHSIASTDLKIISFIARHTFGHRGVIHTPVFCLVTSLIMFLFTFFSKTIPYTLSVGFFFGCILHLAQDSFTRRGIMWLFPINKKYYSIFSLKSGRSLFFENAITTAMLAGIYIVCVGINSFL